MGDCKYLRDFGQCRYGCAFNQKALCHQWQRGQCRGSLTKCPNNRVHVPLTTDPLEPAGSRRKRPHSEGDDSASEVEWSLKRPRVKNASLETSGVHGIGQLRALDAEADKVRSYGQAIVEVAAELICPITLHYPVDPVIAEDGIVYDKNAIESWFSQCYDVHHMSPVSPMTKAAIGKNLLPSRQSKNIMQILVKCGAITAPSGSTES